MRCRAPRERSAYRRGLRRPSVCPAPQVGGGVGATLGVGFGTRPFSLAAGGVVILTPTPMLECCNFDLVFQ